MGISTGLGKMSNLGVDVLDAAGERAVRLERIFLLLITMKIG
jgi:hypothetical protein